MTCPHFLTCIFWNLLIKCFSLLVCGHLQMPGWLIWQLLHLDNWWYQNRNPPELWTFSIYIVFHTISNEFAFTEKAFGGWRVSVKERVISQKGCSGSMVVTPKASERVAVCGRTVSKRGGGGWYLNMTVGDEDGKTLGSGFPHKLRCQCVSGILYCILWFWPS